MCVEEPKDAERFGFGDPGVEEPAKFPLAQMERVCENTTSADFRQKLSNFVPVIRSGDWSDIGGRQYMEDTHVFDGHGGKDAAHFVCDNLPRMIVEDSDFPLQLEKVVRRSFMQIDCQFAETCSLHRASSSGTTALTAMVFGRSLLVANAGDCRAVLSRCGTAVEMSMDHRPCSLSEKLRVESLGGYVDDGYLNGLLGVTRALGDWHLEGMKGAGETGGPLSADPELKMTTLTKDDEFLIIGSDGIWDVFSNQNSVDFARKRLQEHNDVKLCCREIVEEAIRRGATDNLTAVLVSFHLEAPPRIRVDRPGRVERSISAEGLNSLRILLGRQ
uniref:protein-serine/threonine phosphatase n=1 Tax=Zea mays TaxID=4577 RepID=A0A804R1K7_MAIZE